MKRLTISLLLISTISTLYSQTPLESKLFQKINDYRVENGLHILKWDDETYKSTVVHTEYMVKNSELCHREDSETPKFTHRIRLFVDTNSWDFSIVGAENVSRVSFYDIEYSIEDISNRIISGWKSSPPHNDALLSKLTNVGAVSCGDGTKLKNGSIVKRKYSTFVLWIKPI